MGSAIEVKERTAMENGRQSQGDVSNLIQRAIDQKVPVEALEKLVGLQERIMDRNARAAFFNALHAFQDECPEINKAKTAEIPTSGGGNYSYTYAPLEEITRTIRPVLRKHGLSYSWTTEKSDRDDFLNVVCVLRHIDGHETQAVFPVPTHTSAKMSSAQKQGAALTYGRRQSLEAVLGLTTSDDVDGAGQAQVIGEDEYEVLNNLITNADADYRAFLEYMGVEALEDITVEQYPVAKKALESKLKERLNAMDAKEEKS